MELKDTFIEGMAAFRGEWSGLEHIHKGIPMPFKTVNYFQLKGVKDFIENGRVREFPSGFYKALQKDVCELVVKRMRAISEEGDIEYRLIPDSIEIPPNMCFYLGNECMFVNLVKEDMFIGIKVAEAGIRQVFGQYLKYLEEKNQVLSREETAEMIEELIEKYRD